MFPDFIGIGAQKAGTTWLHRNLQAHPQIFMPRKEVHYFDKKINDRSNARTRFFGTRKIDDQWRRQVKHWTLTHLIKKPSLRDLHCGLQLLHVTVQRQVVRLGVRAEKGKVAGEITPAYSVLDRDRVDHVHEHSAGREDNLLYAQPYRACLVANRNELRQGGEEIRRIRLRGGAVPEDRARQHYGNSRITYGPSRTGERATLKSVICRVPRGHPFLPRASCLQSLYEFLGVDPYFRSPAHREEDPRQVRGQHADEDRRAPGAGLLRGDSAPERALWRLRFLLALLRQPAYQ